MFFTLWLMIPTLNSKLNKIYLNLEVLSFANFNKGIYIVFQLGFKELSTTYVCATGI